MDLGRQLATILKEDLVDFTEKGVCINLWERSAKPKMQVEIVRLPWPMATVCIERTDHLPGVREGYLRSICDYLLIFEIENKIHAVFVELKASTNNKQKAEVQLRRSLPILKYLLTACRIEHRSALNESRVMVRYLVIFGRGRLDKQPVRPGPAARIYDEETYEDITIRRFIGTSVPPEVIGA